MSIRPQHFEVQTSHLHTGHRDSSDAFRSEISAGFYSRPEKQDIAAKPVHVDAPHPTADHSKTAAHPEHKANHSAQRNLHSEHRNDFRLGIGRNIGYRELVRDGVFVSKPLEGSVFTRKKPVQYIVLHSTETAEPANAGRVIDSWNNRGDHGRKHHPGAQFVVDRDGKIYTTTSPDNATIHVNNRLTKQVKNDNSVGIEIVHSGHQQYTYAQKQALTRLVSYLQDRYHIRENHIVTHGQIQPATRRDPVKFDVATFNTNRRHFMQTAMNILEKRNTADV